MRVGRVALKGDVDKVKARYSEGPRRTSFPMRRGGEEEVAGALGRVSSHLDLPEEGAGKGISSQQMRTSPVCVTYVEVSHKGSLKSLTNPTILKRIP